MASLFSALEYQTKNLRTGGREDQNVKDPILDYHPIILAFYDEWCKYLDCYEGGMAFTKSSFYGANLAEHQLQYLEGSSSLREYLRPHKREYTDDFEKRKTRTHYFNYCRPSIDFWVSAIFREEQSRSSSDVDVQKFWDNVDGKGTDIQMFMKEDLATIGQIFGFAIILIDIPNPPELRNVQSITEAQAQEFNLFPRTKIISPLQIVNWQTDQLGNFIQLSYREARSVAPGSYNFITKVWDASNWYEFDQDNELMDSGPHSFGRVPAFVHHNVRSRKYEMVGVSAITDIADININLFNISSLIDEYSYDAAFPVLFLEMRDSEMKMITELGVNRALGIPPQTQIPPGFLSPPSDPYRFLLEWMKFQIKEIHRIAMLDNEPRRLDAVDRRSGVKTELDLELQNSRLAKKASNLQHTEERMLDLVLLGLGRDPEDVVYEIKYNKRFDFKILAEEFNELLNIGNLFGESKTLVREKKRQIVRKMVQDPELRMRVDQELTGEVSQPTVQEPPGRQGVEKPEKKEEPKKSEKEEDDE